MMKTSPHIVFKNKTEVQSLEIMCKMGKLFVKDNDMSYKTIDGLMRHLRANNIAISGSTQKRQLRNTGYFHGYKGYRFFKDSNKRIPFSSYEEINSTIVYDARLKSIIYSKMMFIETAVKNIALENILNYVKSESIQAMYDKAVSSYNNCPSTFTTDERRKAQKNKLGLESSIHSNLVKAYASNNPKITHFYNNVSYAGVPIWALLEIMTFGDFGHLLSCLTYDVRDNISKELGLNVSIDTNRQLIYKYIYALKDLRNAVAHNAVVFDTRFNTMDPNRTMRRFLEKEVGLSYVNFKTIGDYIILMSYFLKKLGMRKTEIKAFIREYEKATEDYVKNVDQEVAKIVVHPDVCVRMKRLINYL